MIGEADRRPMIFFIFLDGELLWKGCRSSVVVVADAAGHVQESATFNSPYIPYLT